MMVLTPELTIRVIDILIADPRAWFERQEAVLRRRGAVRCELRVEYPTGPHGPVRTYVARGAKPPPGKLT